MSDKLGDFIGVLHLDNDSKQDLEEEHVSLQFVMEGMKGKEDYYDGDHFQVYFHGECYNTEELKNQYEELLYRIFIYQKSLKNYSIYITQIYFNIFGVHLLLLFGIK